MEAMRLSPRLSCLAAQIPEGARLADVGTDHGKLPVALLQEGLIAQAIGSDIRPGPLSHAEKNAREHGVSLPLRLAAGLQAVQAAECDVITVAGMGGQTIAQILSDAPWTATGQHLLLLQPMTMLSELRQWLWGHGYQIERETVCREEHRLYLVLAARGGAARRDAPLAECQYSPALLKAPHAAEYLQMLLRRERRALAGLERGSAAQHERSVQQKQMVTSLERALEGLK